MVVAGPDTEQLVGRAGGTRRVDDLRALAAHQSPKVRRIVAANPAAPADVLQALAVDGSESVRRRAVTNPSMPISCIVEHRLLLDDPHLLDRAMAGRTLSADDAHLLARAPQLPYRALAASSPALQPDDVRHLATFDDLLGALAAAHPLPRRAFLRATRGSNLDTIEALAGSRWNGGFRRWWLTDGPIGERKLVARRVLAEHDRTSRVHLYRLRWFTRWQVKAALVRRGAVSRSTLRWWTRFGPDGLRVAVAEHPRTPAGALRAMANMSSVCRIAVARNPSLSPQLTRQLAASREPWIAGTALANPNLPLDDIERLAEDASLKPWQLRQLALNPSCPDDTREQVLTWLALGGAGAGDPLFAPDGNAAQRMPMATWEEFAPHLHRLSPVAHFRARAVANAKQIGRNDVRALAHDPSPAVRLAAAGYMDGPTLRVLAYDEDPRVRQRVASAYEDAHRRGVNLVNPGVEPQQVRRRRQLSGVGLMALLAAGSIGAWLDGAGDRTSPAPTFRLDAEELEDLGVTIETSTASILTDPSRPNGAIVDVTLRNGSSVVLVTGASLCEELGGNGFGVERIPITYCDTPGPVTVEIRGVVPQTIVLDPPDGLAP